MSKKTEFTFRRYEMKFRIPDEEYVSFRNALERSMQIDEYGLSTILNVYYDTERSDLISRSLKKPRYKEKIRLRSYGIPDRDHTVFPELKKKVDGIVYKRRSEMPLWEAECFLNEGIRPSLDSQINREIEYVRGFYGIVPKVVLCYDREAFFSKKDPRIRMTIDRNIRYRTDRLSLSEGDDGDLLFPEGGFLLELKVGAAMPVELSELFAGHRVYPVSFSKYGAVYTKLFQKPAAVSPVIVPAPERRRIPSPAFIRPATANRA